MRSVSVNTLTAALKFAVMRCANPNMGAASLLKSEQLAELHVQSTLVDIAENQALGINNDDSSSLAQYLLYRF